jgi:23S rRNA (cytidine1920-2'-O)/16S rRNA (cytidine1409-2'-O)-methyltransferase
MRLDQALVSRGICESREKARRAILAGQVRSNQQRANKPSDWARIEDRIELVEPEKYVSRGGIKLEHALKEFHCDPCGCTAVDLGASTGGFTDCLLQHGVVKVYAVDVGCGQLSWKLRQDPRVVVMEKTNARALTPGHFPQPFELADLIVIDCSFISLRHILPAASGLVKAAGHVIALVKPQFEAGKLEADRGAGVITDPAIHRRIQDELMGFVAAQTRLRWLAWTQSPLLGPAGNKEFFAFLEN